MPWTGWLFWLLTCIVAMYGVVILLDPLPAGASQVFQQFASSAVWFGAAILCLAKGRAAPRERTEWRLFAVAALLWGCGSAYFSIFLWYREVAPVPSVADVLWIAFYLPAYLAIYRLLRKRVGTFARGAWLNVTIGALGVGSAAALMVFEAILDTAGGTPLAVLTNLAYPIGDVGLLALAVAAVTVLGWRDSGALRWIAPAFALFAVADSIYLVQVANGSYAGGGVVDLGWPIAALLIGLAALRAKSPPPAGSRTKTLVGVPEVVGLAAISLLVYDHFAPAGAVAIILATASLVAILLRLYLTVRENDCLLERSRYEAMTDALTGLGNRRRLAADLERHAEGLQPGRPLVLALFDLDGFKQYNDTFGHPAGDQLLKRLGQRLSDHVADCGTAYRMGGDEFCTVWHQWDANIAGVAPEDAATALSEQGEAFAISCSFGVVTLPIETADPGDALRIADDRMYGRKRRGRTSASRQSSDVLQRVLAECDASQGDHMSEVAVLASVTATRLGLSGEDLDLTMQTARLHDVGKVAIPDAIVGKVGPLDEDEWEFMRRHTLIGERIISAAPSLARVARLVRATHETFDGCGYPDGLAGEAIPLIARIVAACDAYHALVTTRPLNAPEAIAELRRCAGTRFDPAVVEALVRGLEAAAAPDLSMAVA